MKIFKTNELLICALLSAISIALKFTIGQLVKVFTGAIGIPGGAVAGGLYMMILPLAICLTKRFGSAMFVAVIQALLVFITGTVMSHGIFTFALYLAPAFIVELIFYISKNKNYNVFHYVFSTMFANIIGTLGSNILYFHLPLVPLIFVLALAGVSGFVGGIGAYFISKSIKKRTDIS